MLICMLFQRMKGRYHSVGDFNLFTVDWEVLAMSPWYNTAAKNTKLVGRRTALLVEWLVCDDIVLLYSIGGDTHSILQVRDLNTSFDRIHIIGSSMGAQAAGYAGFFTGGGRKLLKYN